jgi:hypothetical protein
MTIALYRVRQARYLSHMAIAPYYKVQSVWEIGSVCILR